MNRAILLFAAAILVHPLFAQDRESLIGGSPPELAGEGARWFPSDSAPRLADLHGRVVYVQFGLTSCAACQSARAGLARWVETFGQRGFVAIEVFDGRADGEWSVEEATRGRPWTALLDAGGRACLAWGVRSFPTAVLIDVEGKVVWQGSPLSRPADLEASIERELDRVDGDPH